MKITNSISGRHHEGGNYCSWNRNSNRTNCQNTNAQFLSEKLASLGIDVYYHVAVGDNEGRLFSTIETASKRSDLVILCGGLGPTEDDLTKQTLAKFLGKELVLIQQRLLNSTLSLLVALIMSGRPIMSDKHN